MGAPGQTRNRLPGPNLGRETPSWQAAVSQLGQARRLEAASSDSRPSPQSADLTSPRQMCDTKLVESGTDAFSKAEQFAWSLIF